MRPVGNCATASSRPSPVSSPKSKRSEILLGTDGPFADVLSGFKVRPPQLQLAGAIEAAIEDKLTLIADAGTGTGKTLAYLVPAVLSGARVVVSTGTRALQDQLFEKDIPLLRSATKLTFAGALLKGRRNYLCIYRLAQAQLDGRFATRQTAVELQQVKRWAGRTSSGDVSELVTVREDASVWPFVTSTTDNCLGAECPDAPDCFVFKARRKAQDAQIIVVNHHLFFADMAVKQGGFGEVLPSAEVFVFDEAHQIPETATRFFSRSISARQLRELSNDAKLEAAEESGALATLLEPTSELEELLDRFRLELEGLPDRGAWSSVAQRPGVANLMADLESALETLEGVLVDLAPVSRGLEACYQRSVDARSTLKQISEAQDPGSVYWYELFARSFVLYATPLDIATPLDAFRKQHDAAWIMTSATLAVGDDFSHFSNQLGLEDSRTLNVESPFDYRHNALFYLPPEMPVPQAAGFLEQLVARSLEVLAITRGRAFMLFTSHRALRLAAELMTEQSDYPLFVQGEMPKQQLLEGFRESGNGVLMGAATFWQGVDVAGPALSAVIMDKLPFAAPDDPVFDARLRAMRRAGQNPFFEYQLPQAALAFKQGAGRLIRSVTDYGLLMLGDPRIVTKGYGHAFLDTLPSMPRTRKLSVVQRFFDHKSEEEG